MTILAFFAFLSGIVTILSPCILPVLPIILSGSIGGKRKPIGVVTGFILSFSTFTLALTAIVQTINIPPDALRIAAVVIIIGFGLVLVIPPLQQKFELAASGLTSRKSSKNRGGFGGGILTGASLGLLWTPCVGPIMASVISLAVSRQVDGGAVIIVLAYTAGTAVPMFGVMAGGRRLITRFPKLTSNTVKIQRIFGIIMIIAGIAIATGLDRKFQTAVLNAFPNYGSGLTSFENSDSIRNVLDRRADNNRDSTQPAGTSRNGFDWSSRPKNARLGNFGAAPEIIADGPWINAEKPLNMEDLRGKVVLIDFWTYSCINCVRTLPYLRQWQDRYSGQGLVIIGVHSPEFAFERNEANVRQAVKDLGVTWPVVLDNDFSQWNAYTNRYWPAHYFIDAEGRIRYFHFGEGAYDDSEKVIRKLLTEAGYSLTANSAAEDWKGTDSKTPETYLGYRRAAGFMSESERKNDTPVVYSIPRTPQNGEWGISGEWIIRNDFIELDGSGTLELGFDARDVFLVIEPFRENSSIDVSIDGGTAPDTSDVSGGRIIPSESRVYQLISLPEAGQHVLKLNISGRMRLYAFTFG